MEYRIDFGETKIPATPHAHMKQLSCCDCRITMCIVMRSDAQMSNKAIDLWYVKGLHQHTHTVYTEGEYWLGIIEFLLP